jgi:hypothetical protein
MIILYSRIRQNQFWAKLPNTKILLPAKLVIAKWARKRNQENNAPIAKRPLKIKNK